MEKEISDKSDTNDDLQASELPSLQLRDCTDTNWINEANTLDLVTQVLSQDLHLEIIIDHAVHNNKKLCRKTACAIRLVDTKWFRAVSKVLQKNGESLINLILNDVNSGTLENGKLLDRFADMITNEVSSITPTFSLKLDGTYLLHENFDSFARCLKSCGSALVDLDMIFQVNAGCLPVVFPKCNFPFLKRFSVTLTKLNVPQNVHVNFCCITQHILNSCQRLKEFTIVSTFQECKLPTDFKLMDIPETITKLDLRCNMIGNDVNILVRNKLPRLTSLVLVMVMNPVSEVVNIILEVLNNHRKTLENLTLAGGRCVHEVNGLVLRKFPKMEKLSRYSTNFNYVEEELTEVQYDELFPALRILGIHQQDKTMFRNFTNRTRLPKVVSLGLELVQDSSPMAPRVPLTLENIQMLPTVFPGLQCLRLRLAGSSAEISGLQFIFTNMPMLKQLTLEVKTVTEEFTADHWNAMFVGVTVPFAAGMRSSPNLWNYTELQNDKLPSIVNLKELAQLNFVDFPQPTRDSQILLDMAFQFSFLKMNNLRSVNLAGRFLISNNMASLWRTKCKN